MQHQDSVFTRMVGPGQVGIVNLCYNGGGQGKKNQLIPGRAAVNKRNMSIGDSLRLARAWVVHLYTAMGLLAAFFALQAVITGNASSVFLWLGFAAVVDATDGFMARRFEVSRWLPDFSGRKLDDLVDYINYALIPVFFAYQFALLPPGSAFLCVFVLIAAAYGFCHEGAKRADGFFTGFPNFWNIIVFYLYLFRWPLMVNALVLAFFAILVFVPTSYISSSTRALRPLTYLLISLYFVLFIPLWLRMDNPLPLLTYSSLVFPAYYLGASFYLHFGLKQRDKKELPITDSLGG